MDEISPPKIGPLSPSPSEFPKETEPGRSAYRLVMASACMLFAELLIVRWTGAELWRLSLFKNLVIVAASLTSCPASP